MVENEQCAVFGCESEKRPLDLGHRVHPFRIRPDRMVDLDYLNLKASAAAANRPVATANENSVQPAVERVRVTQRRQALPDADERFLDGIPGRIGVVQDQVGRSEESADDSLRNL